MATEIWVKKLRFWLNELPKTLHLVSSSRGEGSRVRKLLDLTAHEGLTLTAMPTKHIDMLTKGAGTRSFPYLVKKWHLRPIVRGDTVSGNTFLGPATNHENISVKEGSQGRPNSELSRLTLAFDRETLALDVHLEES